MKITALLVGTVLAATLSACGGSDKPEATPDPTAPPSTLPVPVGTIQGRLLAAGGPDGKTRPLKGFVKMSPIANPESVLRADVGEDGRFAIQLAPGKYQVLGQSFPYDDGVTCRPVNETTVLPASKTITVDLLCPVK